MSIVQNILSTIYQCLLDEYWTVMFINGEEYNQDELIKQADHAMYDAKKAGKNF